MVVIQSAPSLGSRAQRRSVRRRLWGFFGSERQRLESKGRSFREQALVFFKAVPSCMAGERRDLLEQARDEAQVVA